MRVRVRFSGHVQGVGFRATVRAIAARIGVCGWVRNEADGSVLAELQGDAARVNLAIESILAERSGHIAHVDRASVSDVAGETGFDIRR